MFLNGFSGLERRRIQLIDENKNWALTEDANDNIKKRAKLSDQIEGPAVGNKT